MDGNVQSVLFITKLMHTDCLNSSLLFSDYTCYEWLLLTNDNSCLHS
jgi:hypothetical protein